MNYFAGLFDAEGYVSLLKSGHFIIGLEVTNQKIPQIFKEKFEGNIYSKKRPGRKQSWEWKITSSNEQCINFIDQINPCSVTKRTQLSKLREYLSFPRGLRKISRDHFSKILSSLKIPLPVSRKTFFQIPQTLPTIEFFQWLAGFFDGDGNFCVYEYKGNKSQIFDSWISVFNTHADTILHVQSRIPGSISQYKGTKNPIWKWVCNQKSSEYVCMSILPFLKIKQKQCNLVIDFLQIKKNKIRETEYSFQEKDWIRDIIKHIKYQNSL